MNLIWARHLQDKWKAHVFFDLASFGACEPPACGKDEPAGTWSFREVTQKSKCAECQKALLELGLQDVEVEKELDE